MKKSQTGVALIESLLIVLILAIVGFGGYYVYHAQKQTDDTLNHASSISQKTISASTNPYASWKIYTSSYEHLNFKYPSNWTLVSQSNPNAPNGDQATLKAPDGFQIYWTAPVAGIGGACDPSNNPSIFIDKVIDLSVSGSKNPLYAVVFSVKGNKSIGIVDKYYISPSGKIPTVGDTGSCLIYATFQSRNSFGSSPAILTFGNALQVSANPDNPSNSNLSDDQYLAQPDIQDTIKIFKSITY